MQTSVSNLLLPNNEKSKRPFSIQLYFVRFFCLFMERTVNVCLLKTTRIFSFPEHNGLKRLFRIPFCPSRLDNKWRFFCSSGFF